MSTLPGLAPRSTLVCSAWAINAPDLGADGTDRDLPIDWCFGVIMPGRITGTNRERNLVSCRVYAIVLN